MAQVAKKAGVSAWTGAWRLPSGKADHQRAVRAHRRRDRGALRRELTAIGRARRDDRREVAH
jgi:hypothetical protein